MSNEGWISIHRKMLTNPLFQAKPFCKGFAWITLLLLTNRKVGYKTTKNGTKIKIKRGECGYSLKALADIFGWSRGKLKRWLESLENDNMTDTKKIGQDCYIIRILNYDLYQNGHQTNTKTDTKTDTQKTSKTDTKKSGTNPDYIYISKSELEKMIQQKIKETDIPSVQKTDTNNNIDIKSKDIYNTHTNNIDGVCVEKISAADMKILRKYAKENGARNIKPYVNKLIENGGYIDILNEEKARIEKEKQKTQRYSVKVEIPPEKNETKEETEEGRKKYLEATKKLRRRISNG